tara:strand:+ start:203 stop:400 length:198 start_codon:yes stop_codon:yes gene_type:complete
MSKVKEISPAEWVRIQDKLMREVPIHEVECKSCDNWLCLNRSDDPDYCDGPEYSDSIFGGLNRID